VFVYDKVFKPNATQESVYNMVAKPIVKGNCFFSSHFKVSVMLNFYFHISCCIGSGRILNLCTITYILYLFYHLFPFFSSCKF